MMLYSLTVITSDSDLIKSAASMHDHSDRLTAINMREQLHVSAAYWQLTDYNIFFGIDMFKQD